MGSNFYGQLNVGSWTDIVQVDGWYIHTVGLKTNGTVVAVGFDDSGKLNVGAWADIVQVTAGYYHTVGLKSDGTVVAVGDNFEGQCDTGGWDLDDDGIPNSEDNCPEYYNPEQIDSDSDNVGDTCEAIDLIEFCTSQFYKSEEADCAASIVSAIPYYGLPANVLSLSNGLCDAYREEDQCQKAVKLAIIVGEIAATVYSADLAPVSAAVTCIQTAFGFDLAEEICEGSKINITGSTTWVLVASPVNLSVMDIESGNKVWIDKNNNVKTDIPGAWIYKLQNDKKLAVINNSSSPYLIEVHGRSYAVKGDSFNLEIIYPINETESLTINYENIPVLPTTIATTSMGENVNEYSLQIDTNGDSIIDDVVLPTTINRHTYGSDGGGGGGGGGCFIATNPCGFRMAK